MPRPSMIMVRKQQLIDATLVSVGHHGLHNTTINTISGLAGLSSGLISHYFGGKQGLIEATQKYLIEQLKQVLLEQTQGKSLTPKQRLHAIVEANFAQVQRSQEATKTWLSFWSQAMHEPGLARLQKINDRRLYSNLMHSFSQLMPRESASVAAKQTAAMIDGFWLRSALSSEPEIEFQSALVLCHAFIESEIEKYGETRCH